MRVRPADGRWGHRCGPRRAWWKRTPRWLGRKPLLLLLPPPPLLLEVMPAAVAVMLQGRVPVLLAAGLA